MEKEAKFYRREGKTWLRRGRPGKSELGATLQSKLSGSL